MKDRRASRSEQAAGPAHCNGGGAPSQSSRSRGLAPFVYWILLVLFVGLQVADIVTTNYALAIPGIWEANPLMALSQARLGDLWWLPKLAVVGYLCFAASLMRRRWPLVLAVSVSGITVLGNLAHL